MKKLSLFVSAFALCASASYAAIDCGSLPSCASLGYTDTVTSCPGEVLKCPFDTTKGKCQRGPTVGDLKYSLKLTNHDGWVLCNGQSLDVSTYSALHAVIGTSFGSDGAKFRVPDYRGFFLRAAGAATNNKALSSYGGSAGKDGTSITNLATPQGEQLPNITGGFGVSGTLASRGNDALFKTSKSYGQAGEGLGLDSGNLWKGTGIGEVYYTFTASNSNSIYSGTHVIPANYPVNIFIYSGHITPVVALWRCNTCGQLHEGSSAPTKCSICNATSFTKM